MHESPGWAEPSVRIRFNRRKGIEEYFFQYWIDVPGREKRKRETEIIGPINTETFKALRKGEPEEPSEKHPSLAERIAQAEPLAKASPQNQKPLRIP